MSKINRYKPYIVVLPEDPANEQMVNGFIIAPNVNHRAIQIERPAGGWVKVLEKFALVIVPIMRQYPKCNVILVIDFDKSEDRLEHAKTYIPDDLKDRVFVIGTQPNPEKLRTALKHKGFEYIGEILAQDCYNNSDELWGHEMLKHNKPELERMNPMMREILFAQ